MVEPVETAWGCPAPASRWLSLSKPPQAATSGVARHANVAGAAHVPLARVIRDIRMSAYDEFPADFNPARVVR